MNPTGNIAIFDLDYTLTIKGTWGRFIALTIKNRPHLWLPVVFVMAKHHLLFKLGKAPRCGVKLAMIRLSIRGWSRTRIETAARSFAENEVEHGLRPGALEALRAHRAAGDTLMIASAAADFIVDPISDLLEIKHYVATRMLWKDDALQAGFVGENCYGPEKLRQVESYFGQNPGLKQKHTKITIYSDSHSDLDLMLWADVAVAVDPDRKLSALAKLHNIAVVHWT